MRFALINSGLGLLAAASELHGLRPDADLILAMDPDGMPWGRRDPANIAARSLAIARSAAGYQPDVIIMACNTGTVHALDVLRDEFEPAIPIVGTVPAVKPAAAAVASVAIWATEATTASEYQRRLIAEFGGSATVTEVACPGLATAIDAGDTAATAAAVASAASRTPAGCGAVVLGCTEYELAADLIVSAVPGARLFGSAAAVAAQAVRRATAWGPVSHRGSGGGNGSGGHQGSAGGNGTGGHQGSAAGNGTGGHQGSAAGNGTDGNAGGAHQESAAGNGTGGNQGRAGGPGLGSRNGSAAGTLQVLLSGRPGGLPPAALRYREGRALALLAPAHGPARRLV